MPRRTAEELDALAIMDPEIEAILKSGVMAMPDVDFSDTNRALKQLRGIVEAWGKINDVEGVKSTCSGYTARDGFENRLLVFRPLVVAKDEKLPIIVHLHGGGGAIGSPESTASFCQALALRHGCVVFAPAYRLAPEYKYPTGVDDCGDAIKHIASQAEEHGADPSLGFILTGHSFGGSTAARVALMAQQLGLAGKITGLYLGTGNFLGREVPDGYKDQIRSLSDKRCINSPILDEATWKVFQGAGAMDGSAVWTNVCNSTTAQALKHQPRTYFQVCGLDVVRDDALIYEDILCSNGVETKLDIYPGAPHIFWSFFPPGTIKQATKWLEDTHAGISWLLRKE